MLSHEAIKKYQKIYRKLFGIEISLEEAAEQATRLLNVARVVFQPMPKSFEKRYNELLQEKHLKAQREKIIYQKVKPRLQYVYATDVCAEADYMQSVAGDNLQTNNRGLVTDLLALRQSCAIMLGFGASRGITAANLACG